MPLDHWLQPARCDNLLSQLLTSESFVYVGRAETVFGIRDHGWLNRIVYVSIYLRVFNSSPTF